MTHCLALIADTLAREGRSECSSTDAFGDRSEQRRPSPLGSQRLTDVYLAGRILKPDYDREWQEIQQQRVTLTSAAPAPLFSQQQSVLQTLVAEWDGMTTDERKRMLAAIDSRPSLTA